MVRKRKLSLIIRKEGGTSLVVRWLVLRAPRKAATGSIPAQRTKISEAMQHSWKKEKTKIEERKKEKKEEERGKERK